MTDTPTPLLFSVADGIARLRMNRPNQLNTIDAPMADAFVAACRTIAADPAVRVVVISGEGRAFGAGGDLASMRDGGEAAAAALIGPMHEAVKILAALDAPVLASVHGVVAGGSMSLALACDLAIAAEGTKFNLAYINIATSSDLSSSYHLPRLVGLRKALEIALMSETFDAAEALRLNLVNRVVPADRLAEETEALARRFAVGPTRALGRIKRLLRASAQNDLATQLDLESEAFRASTHTHDFNEALAAFFAKRKPVFEGR
jgi:2-(1,2-epoxy-1,2-dihydrophenyl)acetyl-CoA isomerase